MSTEEEFMAEFNRVVAFKPLSDTVDHPKHYNGHPNGIECIEVTEHMNFNLGNVVKYVWRHDKKGNTLEDLRKAAWYLNREIKRLGG